MTTPERRLGAIATGQLGLVTRRQAMRSGVTENQLRSRVESGFLQPAGHQTYRLIGTVADERSELLATLLGLGGDAWASGRSAAALHGFDGYELTSPFDIIVLRGRDRRRSTHRVHTTSELPPIDRSRIGGIPVISAARTLIDLARTESTRRLTVALDSGLRDRRLTEEMLHRRIVALRSSGRYGIPALLAVIDGVDVARGGHSFLERHFLQIVAVAGLPRPDCQQVLSRAQDRLVRVDFRFPGTPVVVEVMGYRYHRTTSQLDRDAARINALIADGYLPYQFTYEQVVGRPGEVISVLTAALTADPAA